MKSIELFWINQPKTKKHRMVNVSIGNGRMAMFDGILGGSPILTLNDIRHDVMSKEWIRYIGYVWNEENGGYDYTTIRLKFKIVSKQDKENKR